MHFSHRLVVASGAIVALLSLSACSAEGSAQSVTDACAIAEEAMTDAFDQVGAELDAAFTDIGYGIDVDYEGLFAPVKDAITQASDAVDNAEVHEALGEFQAGFDAFSSAVASADIPEVTVENMTDVEALEEQGAAITAYSETVQAEAQALQESATSIAALCEAE